MLTSAIRVTNWLSESELYSTFLWIFSVWLFLIVALGSLQLFPVALFSSDLEAALIFFLFFFFF